MHTGQNYDYELNEIFFDELGIRQPDHFLDVRRAARSAETIGNVIARSDAVLAKEQPDALLLLGDTNSCLAAIAAKRPQDPGLPHGGRATAASTSACPRRSTAGSSTT